MSFGMLCHYAEATMHFLHQIGLTVNVKIGARGFIDHVEIVDGELRADPAAQASSILHEAGHLAIVPARFRHYLSGNLATGMESIFAELEQLHMDPDAPEYRAMMQSGDTEATAWAWAAGKAIGVPEALIIQDFEYSGDGESIRTMLVCRSYVGIHGISHAGFCVPRHNPYRNLPEYPTLAFWLQP